MVFEHGIWILTHRKIKQESNIKTPYKVNNQIMKTLYWKKYCTPISMYLHQETQYLELIVQWNYGVRSSSPSLFPFILLIFLREVLAMLADLKLMTLFPQSHKWWLDYKHMPAYLALYIHSSLMIPINFT